MKDTSKIRRRPRKNEDKKRNSYSYTITINGKSEHVCKEAFVALHGIKNARLKRKVLNFSGDIADHRGKHTHHNKISDEIKNRIRQHISSFPARESHYSRSKNKTKKYLDASLNIKKLYDMFLNENPDLKDTIKYSFYRDIFNHEFSISFGFPRSDICDTCELFLVKIKAAERAENRAEVETLKNEHELHVKKADVFYTQISELTEAAKSAENNKTGVIAMDYQKNLPLPKTGIGQEYYKRQLWLHNFCIHDNVNERASMYLYAEHYAEKGPNEVISCLDHYISGLSQDITTLHIFCDNCFSQNKNRYIMAYLNTVVDRPESGLTNIQLHYPVPGHSRMPCDRDFGRIEKKQQKQHQVSKPSEYVSMIKSANSQKPFEVVYVEHPVSDNMQNDGTPVVKVKDYKKSLEPLIKGPTGLAKYRGVLFCRGENPKSRSTMTGECTEEMKFLKRGVKKAQVCKEVLSAKPAYINYLPVKVSKYKDVMQLLKYTDIDNSVKFYDFVKGDDKAKDDDDDHFE